MMRNTIIIIGIIMLSLIAYLVMQSEDKLNILQRDLVEYGNKHKQLQDSVKILNTKNQELILQLESYQVQLEELSKIRTTVTTKYRAKQKIINASTSYSELDSIIRTNTGLER